MTATLTIQPSPVPNFSRGRGGHTPQVVTHHVMMGSEANSHNRFMIPGEKASSNYAITHAGQVICYVPPQHTAWANGKMRAPALWLPIVKACWDGHTDPNAITISIEWEGAHALKPGSWTHRDYTDPRTGKSESVPTLAADGIATAWVPTPAQWTAGLALVRQLHADFAIPVDRAHQLRHSDWDSIGRWFCPGPGFPLGQLITDLGGTL